MGKKAGKEKRKEPIEHYVFFIIQKVKRAERLAEKQRRDNGRNGR